MSKKPTRPRSPPSRDDIIAFVRAQTGHVGTRDIARAFDLKNDDRAALKALLRELDDDGVIARDGKAVHDRAALPSTFVAEIIGVDRDGDLLAKPAEWDEADGAPPRIDIHVPRRSAVVPGTGDRALIRAERQRDGSYRGRVLKLLDKARGRVLGIFKVTPRGGRILLVDKKQAGRELVVADPDRNGAEDGDLVSVELLRTRSLTPSARVRERLGSIASEKAISLIAVHAHGIPLDFSDAALREAEAAPEPQLHGREDWRELAFVTIDPPDAKDHDDAVHACPDDDPKNEGGMIVSVAIADVAFYIRPNTALDRDALTRGNSVYFPDRVVPMLPERISNDLCSLKPRVARGALAVRLVIGANGRVKRHTFHRILMRSAAKLSYQQAQAAIDGRQDDTTGPLLDGVLRPLWAASALVAKARDVRQPLDLDLPERKLVLTPDGRVDRVVVPERLAAHRLIEEFMILANVAAAETLEAKGVPLIWRIHDEPGMEKVENLREFLRSLDIAFAKQGALRPVAFNRILSQVKGRDAEGMVNEVVLRSQAQAEYNAENIGHFGLNLRRYAHFTSPIRRYADLIVHRALITALSLGDGGLPRDIPRERLAEIATDISATERRAMKAERETTDRLIAHHLADRVGATFQGRVSGVTRAGLFIKLNDTGADGLVPIRTIGDEYFSHDETHHALIGSRSGTTYTLGDRVTVRLVEAAPIAGALRFEIVASEEPEGGSRGDRPMRSRQTSRPGKARTLSGKPKHQSRRPPKRGRS